MKYIIQLILFSVLSATGLAIEYSELTNAISLAQNPCESIRNSQFVCADCGTLGFCYHQNDEWLMMNVMDCDTTHKMYCNEDLKGCTYQQQCKQLANGPKFECQNPGVYPDPYNCKNYHNCSNNNVDEILICPSGTAYSPATKSCSLSSNDAVCYEPQYNCTTFGQMGAWPSDNNIYYVCMAQNVGGELIRYPSLYRCQEGYNFVQGRCVLAPAETQIWLSKTMTIDSNALTTTVAAMKLASQAMTTDETTMIKASIAVTTTAKAMTEALKEMTKVSKTTALDATAMTKALQAITTISEEITRASEAMTAALQEMAKHQRQQIYD